MAVILGPVPQEQALEYRIERINGTSYIRTWIGPKSALDAIALVEKAFAESIGCSGRGGTYTLVARYTGVSTADGTTPEEPNETQTIDTELVPQSIFLNETFQALSAASQLLIRKVIDNRETRTDAMTVFDIAVTAGEMTLAERTLAAYAWDLLAMGAESFENFAYVLTRTRQASRRWTGSIDLSKTGRIWDTTQLVTDVGNPLLFTVPDLAVTADESAKNLYAGWRKVVGRVTDSPNGQRVIEEQWRLAKWSRYLYKLRDAA